MEDESNLLAAEHGEFILVASLERLAFQEYTSFGRAVEASQEAEERRLSASRRAEDGHELSAGDFQVQLVENRESSIARAQSLRQTTALEAGRWIIHGWLGFLSAPRDLSGVAAQLLVIAFRSLQPERFMEASQEAFKESSGRPAHVGPDFLKLRGGRQPLPRFSVLLLGGLLLVSCDSAVDSSAEARLPAPPEASPTADVASAENQDRVTVAFLGDSISAGLSLAEEQAYPAVLERQLRSEGVPFRLVNAGVSGDTTAGGLARLGWILAQDPQVLVIQLGANDGLRGTPVDSIRSNLRQILERCLAAEVKVLLLGMRLPPSYGASYTNEFAEIYSDLAAELSVPWVPFFMEGVAGVPQLNLPDGIHPTAEGHIKLADTVLPALRPLLEQTGAEQ